MSVSPTELPFLQQLLVGAIPNLIGAGGVGGIWAWHAARTKAKAEKEALEVKARIEAPADMLAAMAAFQTALNEQAEQLTAGLRRELKIANDKLDALAEQHAQCEVNLRDVNARLDEAGRAWSREKAEMQSKIDGLMQGRVAAIGEPAPQD